MAVEARIYNPEAFYTSKEASLDLQRTSVSETLVKLNENYPGTRLCDAGYPGYGRLFIRDTAKSARILGDTGMMKDVVLVAAQFQATSSNPINGAEEGKIFHERDMKSGGAGKVEGRPGDAGYNACDSTAEYLITHEEYLNKTGDRSIAKNLGASINRAVGYIQNHLNSSSIFFEDPRPSGAEQFNLRVTYWKDSAIPQRPTGEPSYPVVYPFAHIQNINGLRSAARLLNSQKLNEQASKMVDALPELYDSEKKSFFIAADSLGPISGISTDNLHALVYLEPGDLPHDIIEQMINSASVLESKAGYRVLDPEAGLHVEDRYHVDPIWTHEQAEIHKGAKRHKEWAKVHGYSNLEEGLEHVMEVSGRVRDYFDQNPTSHPELLLVNGKVEPAGCDPQLWAVAAHKYFLDA